MSISLSSRCLKGLRTFDRWGCVLFEAVVTKRDDNSALWRLCFRTLGLHLKGLQLDSIIQDRVRIQEKGVLQFLEDSPELE